MKNLKVDLQEKALDDILEYAAKEAGNQIIDDLDDMEEIEFSKEHMEKMEKLFKRCRRDEKLARFKKRAGQMVAMFVLVAILASGISIFSVQAWRTKFLNFVTNITESNTEIKFEENKHNTSYSFDLFDINYIPTGYSLVTSNELQNMTFLVFRNNNKEITLQVKEKNVIANIDSEEANVKELEIKNNSAYFTQKNGKHSLTWNDNSFSYILYGDENELELTKIAENIVVKK